MQNASVSQASMNRITKSKKLWTALTVLGVLALLAGNGEQVFSEPTVPVAQAQDITPSVVEKLQGVAYGPSRDGEDPTIGILPTEAALQEDIYLISKLADSVRTYGTTGSLENIPRFSQEVGLSSYPGAWISGSKELDENEIQTLIKIAGENPGSIKGLVVGNEVLLRRDLTEEELISYIQHVKESTDFPVATAEPWYIWLSHPGLVQAVDIILVHIYPYWDGISIDDSAEYVFDKWRLIKESFPDKAVIIGETGWPTEGDRNGESVPSEENQREFLSRFLTLNQAHNAEYFLFEVFDEKWKDKYEGTVGSHWGLYYSNGSMKPLLNDLAPPEAYVTTERH